MVAEILAGAALIKASIDAIKGTIASCKDVSEIATDIDNLFQGQQDIAKDKRKAKATGQSATQRPRSGRQSATSSCEATGNRQPNVEKSSGTGQRGGEMALSRGADRYPP